jgi:hypothetical protein
MHDVTDQYVVRTKRKVVGRYVSIKSDFKVPQAGIETIRSKLIFKIFDEYANILKGMYSTRFNRRPANSAAPAQPPLIAPFHAWQPNNIRRLKEKEKRERT